MARTALGVASRDGITYSWYANGTTTFMYRQNAETGEYLDGSSSPWLDSSSVLLSWVDQSISFNTQMAIGKDKIGIVSQDGASGIQIRIITRSTGATASTTVIDSNTATAQCTDICADDSDNFYVCWQKTGTSKISKYNSAGTLQWGMASSTKVWGCAYDRIRSVLQVCGQALNGGTNTVAELNTSTGAVSDGDNVSSATWFSIQPDGRMGWLIGKANTVARITGDGNYTVTWSRTVTGFTGYQLGAADGSNGITLLQPSSRVTRILGVADGDVTCFDRYGLIPVTSGTNALAPRRPVVYATQNGTKVYFADGVNTQLYNGVTNTMATWSASVGSFPVGTASDYPRLIETWRGRIVMAGIASDPDNYFMSRQNDPTDWNYSAPDDAAAVAGNNTVGLGKPPDIINTIIPINDDRLIFGCDHSIYQMTGDPRHGGTLDVISDTVGMAWGRPWCRDTAGTVYFMSSRGWVYRMRPSGAMEHISAAIDPVLQDIDFLHTIIRMAWDDEQQGCYLILTPLSTTTPTRHFWFDAQRSAWFPDLFKKAGHNPRVVYLYDGDEPNDRVLLIGCNDGYVRYFEANAADDDGQPVLSYVYIGPLVNPGGGVLFKELYGTLGADSGFVNWSVHPGESAAKALESLSDKAGVLYEDRNHIQPYRRHGQAVYVKLYNNDIQNRWALERLAATLMATGRVRGRTF